MESVVLRIWRLLLVAQAGAISTVVCAQASANRDSVPLLDSARLVHNLATLSADSMEGRDAGTAGGERARAFLIRELQRIGLEPMTGDFAVPFSARVTDLEPAAKPLPRCPVPRFGEANPEASGKCTNRPIMTHVVHGANILGVVRGTEFPDRYIVVCAHYDHLGIKEGLIYNGADDNASGSAAILAIAEWVVAHPMRNSILFAWFDAEEYGMIGSTAFVRKPPVRLEQIAADVNVDMVSRSQAGLLFAEGARHYPALQPVVDSVRSVALVLLQQGHDGGGNLDDWTYRSDHEPFHRTHIPYIHFGNEEHPDYHQPTDDFSRIRPGFYYRSARTIAEFVRQLDRQLDRVVSGERRE